MSAPAASAAFADHPGEMGARIRAHDWPGTPLGPLPGWPQGLRTATRLILNTNHPACLFWGEGLHCLYNDAYGPILGDERHPGALGLAASKVWDDVWPQVEPEVALVLAGGDAITRSNHLLPVMRGGVRSDAWWTYSYSPIDCSSVPSGIGGVLVLCVEVTESVRLRDDLRAAVEARTAERDLLWSLSEDLLVLADADGALLRASPSWHRLLGLDETRLHASTLPELLDTADARASLVVMRQTGVPTRFEGRMRASDGVEHIIAWTLSPEPGTGRVVGVGRDVTADRAAAADLARVQAQLHQSQRLETVGQLTGGVAHDFNNLLTPIIGGLDLLRRRAPDDARTQRLIDNAAQSADRARTLVSRLLSFAGRQHLDARPTDVAALVEGMRDLIVRSIGPTIAVAVEAAPDVPPASVDPAQLELALLNLCLNARDAMPDGGRIDVRIDSEARFVRLRVSDTGVGMDAATLARAVEPFFTTKAVGRGTGLGLSMVHGLAAQSGGSLELSSTPGQGTWALLRLPASQQPTASTPADPIAAGDTPAVTVLLVDDEEVVRDHTAELLADLGHTVATAPDAEQAIALIEADAQAGRRIGLLVTDFLLPGQSGADLAAAAARIRPDLPVLLITGYAPLDGRQPDPSLPRLGKPFRQAELAARVSELLTTRSGE